MLQHKIIKSVSGRIGYEVTFDDMEEFSKVKESMATFDAYITERCQEFLRIKEEKKQEQLKQGKRRGRPQKTMHLPTANVVAKAIL